MENPQKTYQRQAIKNASPTELIQKLYDFAIQACHTQDEERLQQVLSALIKSLNFDYEIAGELYNLYEYCQRQAKKEEFDEVRELLEPVREAWVEGVVKNKKTTVNLGGNGFVV
ncbi:MAG: flagellar protein FliS [Balneolaceae bacterium]